MLSENKFGESTNVDSGVSTDVWDRANATHDQPVWVAPTAARIHDIVSTSAADDGDPVGTGAHTVQIYGLDSSWNLQNESITLNGVGNVPTANTYIRIFRIEVTAAGSGLTNAGYITATAQTDTTVTAQVNPGQGQSQMAIYTVPNGYTVFLTNLWANLNKAGGANNNCEIDLHIRVGADVATALFLHRHHTGLITNSDSFTQHQFYPHLPILEKSDIKIVATGGDNNLDVSAGFGMFLGQN